MSSKGVDVMGKIEIKKKEFKKRASYITTEALK